MCGMFRQPHTTTGKLASLWGPLYPAHQMNRVRQASMVQRAAPLRRLVTLTPKKLKKAMEITLAAVVACSDRDAPISCARYN